jgi:hypothetical protein
MEPFYPATLLLCCDKAERPLYSGDKSEQRRREESPTEEVQTTHPENPPQVEEGDETVKDLRRLPARANAHLE